MKIQLSKKEAEDLLVANFVKSLGKNSNVEVEIVESEKNDLDKFMEVYNEFVEDKLSRTNSIKRLCGMIFGLSSDSASELFFTNPKIIKEWFETNGTLVGFVGFYSC